MALILIKGGLAAVGGLLGWFLGGADTFLHALIVFVTVDYITGIMRGIVEKNLCSAIGARGIFKKMLIFLLVGVANIVDVYLINSGNVLKSAVIFFYASNEGISILENTTAIGLPVPQKLRDVLQHLKNSNDGGEPK